MDAGSQIESYLSHVLSEVKDYIQGRHNNDGPAPNESLNSVEACVSLVDEAVSFLRCLLLTVENVFHNDIEELYRVFRLILPALAENHSPRRPSFVIPCEVIEELRGLGYSWSKISQMLVVSRWTIMRRVKAYGLENLQGFSEVSDEAFDSFVKEIVQRHGRTIGQVFVAGYLKSKGLLVQRHRVRESLLRVDPDNRILRWGVVVSRRVYNVPCPNSV